MSKIYRYESPYTLVGYIVRKFQLIQAQRGNLRVYVEVKSFGTGKANTWRYLTPMKCWYGILITYLNVS
ncbi:hypothetical protein JCM15060_04540 [Halanaerobaculum tunisiense]